MKSKKVSLLLKMSIVLMIMFLVLGILFSMGSLSVLNKITEDQIKSKIEDKSKLIDDLLIEFENKGIQLATSFAHMPEVKKSYLYENKEEGALYLKSVVSPIIEEIKQNLNLENLKVHFHKAPATSFLREWKDARHDDLSWFRFTVLEVHKTKKSLKAIELGKGGFAIRGLVPIFNEDEYIGSVEVFFEPFDILPLMISDKMTEGVVLLVDQESAKKSIF